MLAECYIKNDWIYSKDGNPAAYIQNNYIYSFEQMSVFFGSRINLYTHFLIVIVCIGLMIKSG